MSAEGIACRICTSLGWPEVLARGRGPGLRAASLLDAQGATLDRFTLESLSGCISLIGGDHLDETEAARLLAVRVTHDLGLLDVAVLLEHLGDLGFRQTGVNASDEEVRAGVYGAIVVFLISGAR